MRPIIHQALALSLPQFRLDLHASDHGIAHWARVWLNARALCAQMNLDPTIPCWFSFLHDSQRHNDGYDSEHGPRACEWIDRLSFEGKLNLAREERRLLTRAISAHSQGETSEHPIVQVCWDADRLDLGRVSIRPHPKYLCTDAAKRPKTIEAAWARSRRWSDRAQNPAKAWERA